MLNIVHIEVWETENAAGLEVYYRRTAFHLKAGYQGSDRRLYGAVYVIKICGWPVFPDAARPATAGP